MKYYSKFYKLYDCLAWLTTAGKIRKNELQLLPFIPKEIRTCIIIGGGSGFFLEKLVREYPDLKIIYVETAQRMIERAKDRIKDFENIEYYLGSYESLASKNYDLLVTNYFLDLLNHKQLENLYKMFKPTYWYIADFDNRNLNSFFQRFLLKAVYRLFYTLKLSPVLKLVDYINISKTQYKVIKKGNALYGGMLQCYILKRV